MKYSTLLIAIFLLAVQVDASQSRKTSLPHVADGYSLFSWTVGNDWDFSLIEETGGARTYEEVISEHIRIKGIGALKRKLSELPKNEVVVWATDRFPQLSFPPDGMLRQINAHARRRGIKLTRVII